MTNDELTGKLITANVRIQALESKARNMQALLASAEERGEHYRTEMKRLEQEAERLAKRNALLVAEIESAKPINDLSELELIGNHGELILLSTSECDCHGKVVTLEVSDDLDTPSMIVEIRDREIVHVMSNWMRDAARWIGGTDERKRKSKK